MATIRLRRDSDLAECAEALKAVYAACGYPVIGVTDPIGFLQTDDLAWVAEDGEDGALVGHIALTKASAADPAAALWWEQHPGDARIAVVGRLFVHPGARGGGTARRLIQTAVEEARRRGLRLVMFALAMAQDAMRLYRRLGWEHFGSAVFRWDGGGKAMAAECFASPAT